MCGAPVLAFHMTTLNTTPPISEVTALAAAAAATPSFRPLYEQIKLLLTQSLVAGEWKPGEPIPSEIELAARYGVSQGTVRKAIDALAAEHILLRRQGKGTYVASHNTPTHQYRFLRMQSDDGDTDAPTTEWVSVERVRVAADVAAALSLRVGATAHHITRVLRFAGKPIIFDEIYLAAALFPGLTRARLEESKGSIYSFLELAYGVRMIRGEEQIKAVAADRALAKYLNVPTGTPLLSVDRIAYTYGDKPVEWRRGMCLTHGFSYRNELA